jgi:hypothetical protein
LEISLYCRELDKVCWTCGVPSHILKPRHQAELERQPDVPAVLIPGTDSLLDLAQNGPMKRHIAKELNFETLLSFNRQTLSVLCNMDENKPLIFTAVLPFIALPLHWNLQSLFI